MLGEATQSPPAPAQAAGAETAAAADEGLRRPISDAEPTGSDPKLIDEFDTLQGEIAKLEMVTGDQPDWALVRETSRGILENKAKDLRCLVWWTHACFRLEGGAGLQAALAETSGCVQKFAAGLHPKRDKARAAALDWLGARLEADLPLHLKSAPAELLEKARKSIDELQDALKGACASFDGLQRARSALKGVKAEVPKPTPAAKPAAGPAAGPRAGGSMLLGAAKPAAAAAPVAPEGLEDVVEQLLERASQLAAGDGESALSLRLRRQALWLVVPAGPVGGKKYECESITPKLRMELDNMGKAEKWPEVLERTEELFPQHPFCLDLTYWAAQAAGALIDAAARDALAGELVALTIRAPKLPRGTDLNGQPLASAHTRSFISQLMAPKVEGAAPAASAGDAPAAAAPAAAPAAAAVAAAAAAIDALPADVEALLAAGKTADAVRLASAATVGLSGRAAFCRHLVLAERLQAAGTNALAYSLFRALMGRLRTASLSQWEPSLEARCIRGYLQGARAAKEKLEGERELLDTLMLLDPGAAVGLV